MITSASRYVVRPLSLSAFRAFFTGTNGQKLLSSSHRRIQDLEKQVEILTLNMACLQKCMRKPIPRTTKSSN